MDGSAGGGGGSSTVAQQQQRRKQKEERLQELRQEEARLQTELELEQFAFDYRLLNGLSYPTKFQSKAQQQQAAAAAGWVAGTATAAAGKDGATAAAVAAALAAVNASQQQPLRTNDELLQLRLIEAGLFYNLEEDNDNNDTTSTSTKTTVADVLKASNRFIAELEKTGCFQSIQVQLGTEQPGLSSSLSSATTTTTSEQQQSSSQKINRLTITLEESKWYTLYVGGGIKASSTTAGSAHSVGTGDNSGGLSDMMQPEVRVTLGFRNLTGFLDTTLLQYELDAAVASAASSSSSSNTLPTTGTWSLMHQRPLYSLFGTSSSSWIRNWMIQQPHGSQYTLHAKGMIDTLDYESTRSYKEFQRLLSCKLTNTTAPTKEQALADAATTAAYYFQDYSTSRNNGNNNSYSGYDDDEEKTYLFHFFSFQSLEWMNLYRDTCPRRHAALPYAFDASPAIVSQSGPSVKNSFLAETVVQLRSKEETANNTTYPSASSPPPTTIEDTTMLQGHASVEMATPPGDVGFFKCHGGASLHLPIYIQIGRGSGGSSSRTATTAAAAATATAEVSNIIAASLDLSLVAGYLRSVSFGGLCRPATVSDRFFVGGPLQLRGFSPAGIGPRAYPNYHPKQNQPQTADGSGAAAGSDRAAGDALGGDFYYTASAMASISPPLINSSHPILSALKGFFFLNAGTCVGTLSSTPLWAILHSTRLSCGVGCASTALFGPTTRLEVTYAVPLRFGPRDIRRNVQFGLGFSV